MSVGWWWWGNSGETSLGKPSCNLGASDLPRLLGSHSMFWALDMALAACSASLAPQGPGAEVTPTQPATAACQPHTNRCLGAAQLQTRLEGRRSDLPWRAWLPLSFSFACCCSRTNVSLTHCLSFLNLSHFSFFLALSLPSWSSLIPLLRHFFHGAMNDARTTAPWLTLMKDVSCQQQMPWINIELTNSFLSFLL